VTIEAWNLLFSAGIAALLLVGGVWLKHVVNQQLKSKDTAIHALEAVIKIKEAEISSLKADTAPAITKAYGDMRQHANQMTDEAQRLSEEVKNLTAHQQRNDLIVSARLLLSESTGLTVAQHFLHQNLGQWLFPNPPKPPAISAASMIEIINRFTKTFAEVNVEVRNRHREIDKLIHRIASQETHS
jgi:hypothetical protein